MQLGRGSKYSEGVLKMQLGRGSKYSEGGGENTVKAGLKIILLSCFLYCKIVSSTT